MEINDKKEFELEEKISSGAGDISDYFDLGSIYLIRGLYDKLFALYNQFKNKELSNTDLARVYHEEGEALLRCGKRDNAKIIFEKSLRLLLTCDETPDCLIWKGLNHYNLFLLENDPEFDKEIW